MNLGYIFALGYVLLLSLSTIWVDALGAHIPVLTLLFYTTITAIVSFNLVRFKRIKTNHKQIAIDIKEWAKMGVLVSSVWFFTYYGAIHSSPDFLIAVSYIFMGLLGSYLRQNKLKIIACAISIGLCCIFSPNYSLLGLLVALSMGGSLFTYLIISDKFCKKYQMEAGDILAIRYYLLLIGVFIAVLISKQGLHSLEISWQMAGILITLGLANMVIPIFCSQSALGLLGASELSFITSLLPVIGFIFTDLTKHAWHPGMLFACTVATIALNIDKLASLSLKLKYRVEA